MAVNEDRLTSTGQILPLITATRHDQHFPRNADRGWGPTKFDKVIILQRVLDCIICVQQTQTLTPAHHEAQVLHGLDAAVVRLVLHVALEGLLAEPQHGVLGVTARHGQPLVADVHGETRHRAWFFSPLSLQQPSERTRRAAACHRWRRSNACTSATNQRRRSRATPYLWQIWWRGEVGYPSTPDRPPGFVMWRPCFLVMAVRLNGYEETAALLETFFALITHCSVWSSLLTVARTPPCFSPHPRPSFDVLI